MLPEGLYERLLDEELEALVKAHPELTANFEKLDDEEQPHAFAQFFGQVLRESLPVCDPAKRREIINRLLELLCATDGLAYTQRKKLLDQPKILLRQIRSIEQSGDFPQPVTSLSISSLLTGAGDDPRLERELRSEMMSADRVDILVSFIKWSGLRLLLPAFEVLADRGVPVRVITTSYMGASDPKAVEWLASKPSFTVRVSYDTERTRLHAKAYHFIRNTGYSTAYIGSANMSQPAMTSGLEWTVKVTAQDMPHIIGRFSAEFETYWARDEFTLYDGEAPERFREAIAHAKRKGDHDGPRFFADLKPHPFQERILEALAAERLSGSFRNLVVAATGTGKTVMAAFDYARFKSSSVHPARLLFVVHRKEILYQALDCFRSVLRDYNFGELLVGGQAPQNWDFVFASIQSLTNAAPWEKYGADFFDFVIIDEAHHGSASSYRPLFDNLCPKVLLGLTATPERMDHSSILPDFENHFAAEIRLPEALEEKLLCPFHYFGVSDPVSVADERFWRNGKYDTTALEDVYTGDDIRATDRLNAVLHAITKYHPNIETTHAVGFCASVKHAKFMQAKFKEVGYSAEVVLGETPRPVRDQRIEDFRAGRINFLFTVDVVSEGVDIPEINLVLFLRPTESLTVFLQQLGRGLRHAPEKDCLTVLDFVGQAHRKYRADRKFSALLRHSRRRIDAEIQNDFPNLPPGCNIHLERVAREHILENIRQSLGNLNAFIPEAIRTFEAETSKALSFGNFVRETGLSPLAILKKRTWSEWKDLAAGTETVNDPDLAETRKALRRLSLRTDPDLLEKIERIASSEIAEDISAYGSSEAQTNAIHYLLWGKDGEKMGVSNARESIAKWVRNQKSAKDLIEISQWRRSVHPFPTRKIELGYPCDLHLHAAYGYREITAAFGKATLDTSGPAGVGVVHIEETKTYIHFVTFRKEDKDFSPTTRYKDYPISRTRLHWESQAVTTQSSTTGQNYIHFKKKAYTILFFARLEKQQEGETSPYIFLGPALKLESYESNRPIKMIWDLVYPIPAELYEEARTV
jgi:superfamily II DNA or RNA helicase/HKD family nuclease